MSAIVLTVITLGFAQGMIGITSALDDGAQWVTCVYVESGPVTRVERCER